MNTPTTSSPPGTQLLRSTLALALALTGLAGVSPAQTVTYDIRGTVTSANNFTGFWAGVSVGDPFRVLCTLDTSTPGDSSGSGTTYPSPLLAIDIDVNGITSSTYTGSSLLVLNDSPVFASCTDGILLTVNGPDFLSFLFTQVSNGQFSNGAFCCPNLVSSEALPLALSLDWDTSIIQLFDNGDQMEGTVESIVVSTPQVPPQNDNLSGAAVIGPGLTDFDTTLATTDGVPLDPSVCDMGPLGTEQIHQDVWYRFTPSVSDNWQITTTGLAGFDTRIAVYDPSLATGPGTIRYEYSGTVLGASPPLGGIWACAGAGTPYTASFVLDANAVGVDHPVFSYQRNWTDHVLSQRVTIGGATDASPVTSSSTEVEDDFDFGTGCQDSTTTSATTAGYTVAFQLREETTGGCPQAIQSLDLPTALDLSQFTHSGTNGTLFDGSGFAVLGIDELVVSEDPFAPYGDPLAVIACNDNEDAFPPNEAGVTVALTAGTEYVIRLGSFNASTGGGAGQLLVRVEPDPTAFCNAEDGSLAACPCSNPGNPETGCDIQQGTGGVKLDVVAVETNPSNRVTVSGAGFPSTSTPTAVVIRAPGLDPAAPVVFGDGLRCIGTPLVRLGADIALFGNSTHTFGHGTMAGAGTFYYQLWFRNTPAMFCTPAAFNLSNGRILDW